MNEILKKNAIDFAYYHEIAKIDTVFKAGLTYSPYMTITKNDGAKFKVSINGTKEEVNNFFEDAIGAWGKRKDDVN